MTRVRIGVQIHPQHGDMAGINRAARQAEEMGADVLYVWDHFYPLYGDPDGTHFECWTILAAWAVLTSRIEIGALVTCNSYRNPQLLADMARTIDHISPGRLLLGIGSGWFQRDYDEYGYPFGTAGSRLDDLARSLPLIVNRWEKLNPPPTRKIPVLIAGTGHRKTLPLVARYADGWHAAFPDEPAELVPTMARLKECCAEIGRDPATIECGLGVESGRLDTDVDEYLKMGFTQITLGINGPEYDLSHIPMWIRWRDSVNGSST
jgi:probable F420-dependent oxidoreductase